MAHQSEAGHDVPPPAYVPRPLSSTSSTRPAPQGASQESAPLIDLESQPLPPQSRTTRPQPTSAPVPRAPSPEVAQETAQPTQNPTLRPRVVPPATPTDRSS